MVTSDVLLPLVDDDSAGFWEGTVAGELRMQACGTCGRLRFPPRPMCPHCRSMDSEWRAVSGRGAVWSFVVTHPPLLPAYEAQAPYNVVVVALDEDPELRMVGNVVARAGGRLDEVDPSTIAIGDRVRVVFDRVAEDVALPRWIKE